MNVHGWVSQDTKLETSQDTWQTPSACTVPVWASLCLVKVTHAHSCTITTTSHISHLHTHMHTCCSVSPRCWIIDYALNGHSTDHTLSRFLLWFVECPLESSLRVEHYFWMIDTKPITTPWTVTSTGNINFGQQSCCLKRCPPLLLNKIVPCNRSICERDKLKWSLSPKHQNWDFHKTLHRHLKNKFCAKMFEFQRGKVVFQRFLCTLLP